MIIVNLKFSTQSSVTFKNLKLVLTIIDAHFNLMYVQ